MSSVLGAGYSTFENSFKSKILDVTVRAADINIELKTYVCIKQSEIYKILNIYNPLSSKAPHAELESRYAFAEGLTSSGNAVTLLVIANNYQSKTVDTAKFSSVDPLSASYIYAAGGDRYVSLILEGGQFIIAFQYLASLVTRPGVHEQIAAYAERELSKPPTKESIEATIEALYRDLKVWFSQSSFMIGCSEQPKDDDWHNSLQFGFDFGKQAMDEPKLLGFEAASYSTVPGCPADFNKSAIDASHSADKHEDQRSNVADLRRLWNDLSKRNT